MKVLCVGYGRLGKPVVAAGETVVVERRKRHLYFDFETCDDLIPGVDAHVYMIGLWDLERDEFKVFTAKGADDEARIFQEFFEYVGDFEDAVLYHWFSFEVTTMKQVAERRPEIAGKIADLLPSLVDLMDAIKNKVFFDKGSYSIKKVAPAIGFNWKQEDVDAMESMVLYWEYLEDGDQSKMDKIIQYNKDDCEAMVAVDRWLQAEGLVAPPPQLG